MAQPSPALGLVLHSLAVCTQAGQASSLGFRPSPVEVACGKVSTQLLVTVCISKAPTLHTGGDIPSSPAPAPHGTELGWP